MADVSLMYPFDDLRGKVSSTDEIYFRKRNGKLFSVRLQHPRKKFTAKEKGLHTSFGEISKRASAIAKDPEQAALFMEGFESQKENGQKSLYQYIVTQLMRSEMGRKN